VNDAVKMKEGKVEEAGNRKDFYQQDLQKVSKRK
jgi:hypothetical protein